MFKFPKHVRTIFGRKYNKVTKQANCDNRKQKKFYVKLFIFRNKVNWYGPNTKFSCCTSTNLWVIYQRNNFSSLYLNKLSRHLLHMCCFDVLHYLDHSTKWSCSECSRQSTRGDVLCFVYSVLNGCCLLYFFFV